jgi:integral membrane protein (TIGR01906 family)
LPYTTEALSSAFSQTEQSSFTSEELTSAAKATRDYTIDTNNKDDLFQVLYNINLNASLDGRAAVGSPKLPDESSPTFTQDLAVSFESASEKYVLTPEALSHLDDVYSVISAARIALGVIFAVCVVLLIITGFFKGARTLGKIFMGAALSVIICFALLGLWAALDFNGFFVVFHSLFFAEGSWTFSADSLLICLYPIAFWIGMAVVWLLTTLLISLLALIIGRRLIKRR